MYGVNLAICFLRKCRKHEVFLHGILWKSGSQVKFRAKAKVRVWIRVIVGVRFRIGLSVNKV